MFFRHDRRQEPDINLTPLIDVVFLLLIFFMVSTTFDKSSEVNIELPEASGKVIKDERFTIEVSIDGQGFYFVNEKRVKDQSLENLKRAIRLTRGKHKDPKLIISADKNTPHQYVIRAMDAAKQVGLVNLTFATKQSAGK